jgi:hypothetical protein
MIGVPRAFGGTGAQWLGLALLALLAACGEAQEARSLLGASTIPSDAELARENITIELRDLSDRDTDSWPTLRIVIAPTGTVTTQRGRFFPEPPTSLPIDTIQVTDHKDTATLSPERAGRVRRALAGIRPRHFFRSAREARPESLPACSLDRSHDPSVIMVQFSSPSAGHALFLMPSSCGEAEQGRARQVIAAARHLLPASAAAAGFSY